MTLRNFVTQLPIRLASGAFILNSGLAKRQADQETAQSLHGFAAGTYPLVQKLSAEKFVGLLSTAEIAVGTAVLVPLVPAKIAGAAVTAFSGSLLGLYLKTPGMRREGTLRPTREGTALAKDVWLMGIGLSLLLGGILSRDGR